MQKQREMRRDTVLKSSECTNFSHMLYHVAGFPPFPSSINQSFLCSHSFFISLPDILGLRKSSVLVGSLACSFEEPVTSKGDSPDQKLDYIVKPKGLRVYSCF